MLYKQMRLAPINYKDSGLKVLLTFKVLGKIVL